MSSSRAPIQVTFYNGIGGAINLGKVAVDHSLNFKKLLCFVNQKTGISPHQFTFYLNGFKIPITSKLNISAVAHEIGACFVSVKRSRRFKKAPTPANGKKMSWEQRNSLLRNMSIYGSAGCEQCMRAYDYGFHLCENDKIIVGFRSTAGPVSRPVKNSGEECP